jgi:ABC-type oligopeptide transport system ATPase subunit
MKPLIEVVNLKKYFNTGRGLLHAVDGVSFHISKGETLGVVGESGCGKSTLGRVCVHLLEKTDGQIYYDGEDISNPGKARLFSLRNDMQMIFQDPYSSVNPRMTVKEIIAEPLIIYKKFKTRKLLDERVVGLMDKVGLASRVAESYPHELDGGRRQRIGVARALALEPQFIVWICSRSCS